MKLTHILIYASPMSARHDENCRRSQSVSRLMLGGMTCRQIVQCNRKAIVHGEIRVKSHELLGQTVRDGKMTYRDEVSCELRVEEVQCSMPPAFDIVAILSDWPRNE